MVGCTSLVLVPKKSASPRSYKYLGHTRHWYPTSYHEIELHNLLIVNSVRNMAEDHTMKIPNLDE